MSRPAAVEALGDAQGFAVGVARYVENGFVVEAGGFHDQGVTFSMYGGVAEEGR